MEGEQQGPYIIIVIGTGITFIAIAIVAIDRIVNNIIVENLIQE